MSYVMRQGRRIEVVTLGDNVVALKTGRKRGSFEVSFVKFPRHWASALRNARSVSTYQLAIAILFEAFKRSACGDTRLICLSATMTGMPDSSRRRAIGELVEFGLIKIKREGKRATLITKVML